VITAHLMLADHAQSAGGKLFVCGGGINLMGPVPTPFAIVLEFKVGWHDNNRKFGFVLELVDEDGNAFEVETDQGKQPLSLEGEFAATASPDARPGAELVSTSAINLPPLPFEPGRGYVVRLSIEGETRDEWRIPFWMRALPQQRAV
jgi:hypothetical protein